MKNIWSLQITTSGIKHSEQHYKHWVTKMKPKSGEEFDVYVAEVWKALSADKNCSLNKGNIHMVSAHLDLA